MMDSCGITSAALPPGAVVTAQRTRSLPGDVALEQAKPRGVACSVRRLTKPRRHSSEQYVKATAMVCGIAVAPIDRRRSTPDRAARSYTTHAGSVRSHTVCHTQVRG
jgi:hypothetical protein